jgi:acetyl esterase
MMIPMLDERVQEILRKFEREGLPSTSNLTVTEARRFSREMDARLAGLAGPPVDIASVRNTVISTVETEIQIRVYAPKEERDLPALVYLHGGGWVLGDLDSVDRVCRSLSVAAGCVVFSVDYRLAPENKFPIPVEDCYQATNWIVENGTNQRIDPTRVAVGGDSAGGNLAAAVCLMARDRGRPSIAYQLLIYPITNHSFHTQSYKDCATGYYLTTDDMKWFWNHYLRNQRDGENPYASPLAAKNLKSLPPALVITAEFDPLRDEGEAYATRLQEAGVPARASRYNGLVHGFLDFAELKQTRAAIEESASELRMAFYKKR